MRTLFFIIATAGSLIVGYSDGLPANNAITANQQLKESEANSEEASNLVCAVVFSGETECSVEITAMTTNVVVMLTPPSEMRVAVHLFDSLGHPVEKTEYGKTFGYPLTQKEINDWIRPRRISHGWSSMIIEAFNRGTITVARFDLKKIFQIKQAGEYTFRAQVRLIQTCRDREGNPRKSICNGMSFSTPRDGSKLECYQATWLPEVTAKIQIRPEDIAPQNLLPNAPTNSLSK